MHVHITYQLINERLAALFICGSLDAVRQFNDCNHRHSHFDVAVRRLKLLEDLTNAISTTLAGDDHGRVED